MAKKYGWLDPGKNESSDSYDSRINHLAAFHAGYAFFSRENYDPGYAAFSVYLLWNGEFNSKLEPALPDGGFMIHCSEAVADRFASIEMGLPVYVKLYSSNGKLSAEQMTVADHLDYYDLYFNGCEVRRPEMLYFARRRAADQGNFDEGNFDEVDIMTEDDADPGIISAIRPFDHLSGSYVTGSYLTSGSFGLLSIATASGSYTADLGSFTVGSYKSMGRSVISIRGSYGSFMSAYGSYSLISFLGSGAGAGRNSLFQLGSYLRGSYLWNFTGFLTGSVGGLGSFNLKSGFNSANSSYFNSSFKSGFTSSFASGFNSSYSGRAFGYGSFAGGYFDPHVYRPDVISNRRGETGDDSPNTSMVNGIRPAESLLDFIPKEGRFRPSYRMIAEMGYGLDLI